MPSYTTTDLISTIKTKGLVPTNQSTFTSANILKIADEEIQNGIMPEIMSVREDYFVTYLDYTINPNQNAYAIPTRAVGSALQDVTIVNGSGSNLSEYSIPMMSSEQARDRSDPQAYNMGLICYLQGNNLMLNPYPTSNTGSLRLYYVERRNSLVDTTAAGRIDTIDTVTNSIVLGNTPSTFISTVTYDFVKAKPGFDNLDIDVAVVSIVGSTFTFASLPTGLAVGDYLCLAGESCIVQLPVEFQPVLAQRVIVRLLEAIGDSTGVQIARTKLEELQRNALSLISPRITGAAKKILNPSGVLNGRSSFPWRTF